MEKEDLLCQTLTFTKVISKMESGTAKGSTPVIKEDFTKASLRMTSSMDLEEKFTTLLNMKVSLREG